MKYSLVFDGYSVFNTFYSDLEELKSMVLKSQYINEATILDQNANVVFTYQRGNYIEEIEIDRSFE